MSTLDLRQRAARLREGLDDIKGGTRQRVEELAREIAGLAEQVHDTQQEINATRDDLATRQRQLAETIDGLPEMVDAVEAAVTVFREEGVTARPAPAAPVKEVKAAPRYTIEAPTAHVTEDMPSDHAELDPLTVYRFRPGDERAMTQARVARDIARIESPCAHKGAFFIAASVNDILGVVSEHFEGEPWELLRAGTLPYATVIDASKYAASGGIDAGSVQRGIEIDQVLMLRFAFWALIQDVSGRL